MDFDLNQLAKFLVKANATMRVVRVNAMMTTVPMAAFYNGTFLKAARDTNLQKQREYWKARASQSWLKHRNKE